MDFLQALKAHRGGLLRLKTQLYWYGGRGPDGSPGQVCLLLDAAAVVQAADRREDREAVLAARAARSACAAAAAALLLIDGCPQWVWVGQEGVELIT